MRLLSLNNRENLKQPSKNKKAISQEIAVAHKLGAKIIVATDTKDTLWVNALTGENITDEHGNPVLFNFDISDEKLPSLIEKINYSINEKNNQILPKKLVNPTDLARSIWQDIWSVSGATPENCLYTFVELFIFKYLSDLGILKNTKSFDFVMKMYFTDSDDVVLQYYADNIRKEIKELFPENTIDHTTIINGTIFVSKDQKAVAGYSTVFKKVLQRFQVYGRLEHIDYDFKSKLFESFLKESISKKNWGQFFTPMKVIRAIEKIAKDEIKEGAVVCDPACGVGKFLLEPIKSRLDRFYSVEGDKVIPKITIRGFDKGFDKDEQKTIILAKANMLIYFSEIIKDYPNHTKEFAKIFNDSFTLKTNSILGTLRDPVENEYDLILTNPPYVTSGSSNLKEEIQKDTELKNYYKINAMGVEGLFMEWIVRALKPNGKAFIVVPDGIFNRQNDKNLRTFLRQECFIDGIISLPLNTFFTTNKKTYIFCITKKNNKSDIQIDPVFTYLVSEIGESRDVYRFDIEQNDLDEATTLYGFFKGNKSSFAAINNDSRCKVVPIEKFDQDSNWCVDRWWSKEEKVVLGVEEEDKSVKFEELPYFVENIADNIMSFKNLILELNEKKKINLVFKEIQISNIFDIKKGLSKYTNAYVNAAKNGFYDLYSSQTKDNGVIGKIDTYDYDCECLTWTTDGIYAGTVFYRNGKFSMTTHCGALIPKNLTNLSIKYLESTLNKMLRYHAKGEGNKRVTVDIIKKIMLPIPICADGKFDLEAQQMLVEKYEVVTELKIKAEVYGQAIKNLTIEIDDSIVHAQSKTIAISEIFELPSIKGVTKSFVEANKGDIPVYGGKMHEEPIGYVADGVERVRYFENCLAWNRNGTTGYVFYHNHKFSTTDDHRPLIVKKVYQDVVDLEYARIFIQKALLEKFSWSDKAGKDKVEKITITLPILTNGVFDILRQRAIAEKYKKLEEIKNLLFAELNKIRDFSLEL